MGWERDLDGDGDGDRDGSQNEEKQYFVFVIPDPHPMDCTRWFAQVDRNCVAQDGIRRIGSLVDTERDIRKTVTTLHKCFARCVI